MSRADAALAAHRFGLGPAAGELERIGNDPRGWLLAQLDMPAEPTPAFDPLPPASENVLDWWASVLISVSVLVRKIRTDYRDLWRREAEARLRVAVTSEQPFRERLVAFWGSHFTCSGVKSVAIGMAGGHEREAVRPHVTGSFRDMLHDAVSHPAMLFYLDNYRSAGGNSMVAGYRRRGLNENLAREVLELHTLGVNGGYEQSDVTEFAKVLTGWTFGRAESEAPGGFLFDAGLHEPGSKQVLGETIDDAGEAEGRAVLDRLARHPATARHIADKLARHFVADTPPPALVDRLAARFQETEGDLKELARTLVRSDEAWMPERRKLKSPFEFAVGVHRALGLGEAERELFLALISFGQAPFYAPSPAGWPDHEAAWLNPDAAMRRVRFAHHAAWQAPGAPDPASLAAACLDTLIPAADLAECRAAGGRDGVALLLASPAFQRR